jgi:hypothetical protein
MEMFAANAATIALVPPLALTGGLPFYGHVLKA